MGLAVTPGAGAVVAADIVGTPSAPSSGQAIGYSKIDIGDAGASSPVTAGNPLPVSLSGSVAVTGTFWQTTQPVSIAAAITTNADGSVAAGAAASKSLLAGGVYNTSLPTLTNTQQAALQVDSSGRLIVNVGAGSSGNGAASNTGSAVPAQADYGGVNVAGTLRGMTGVNPTGSVYAAQVDLASFSGSVPPSPASANIASLPTSDRPGALYVNATQVLNTAGTTTTVTLPNISEAGNTVFDITSAFLVITNPSGSAQTITSGNLTFSDTIGGIATSIVYPFPSTFTIASNSNGTLLIPVSRGVLKNAQVNLIFAANPTAGTATVNVTYQSNAPTLPPSLVVSGTGVNLNDTPVPATDVSGYKSVSIQGSGSTAGANVFEASNDGTNWLGVTLYNLNATSGNGAIYAGSFIANTTGIWAGCINFRYFRVRCNAGLTGTATVTAVFSTNAFTPHVIGIGTNTGIPVTNAVSGDGIAASIGLATESQNVNFNGTNWDRQRGVTDVSIYGSLARTAPPAVVDQTNYNGKGVRVVLNVTAASGTGGLQIQIRGKDSISATYYQINANPTAVTATGIYIYDIYPGIGAAAGGITQTTSGIVPRTWTVNVAHGDGTSYTYSVSGVTLP